MINWLLRLWRYQGPKGRPYAIRELLRKSAR